MNVDNETPFEVALVPAFGPGDQPVVTVVVKATYAAGEAGLSVAPSPLAIASKFLQCSGRSAMNI